MHGYFPEYLKIAAELGPSAKVLELGVWEGESLRMWQALFPTGEITGVDSSPDVTFPKGTRRVIAEQDDPKLAELGPFDLIVDDASHDGNLTRKSFLLLWDRVNPGGFYVIEDWFVGIRKWVNGVYDPVMLGTVQGLLHLLDAPDSACESILYKYGLAICKKRAAK